jgi:hypothetical protein
MRPELSSADNLTNLTEARFLASHTMNQDKWFVVAACGL